jgi:hypothetical protein
MKELRQQQQTERWVAGTLCLARLTRLDEQSGPRAVPWLLAAMASQSWLPPFGFYVDVGLLLEGSPLDFSACYPVSDGALRGVMRRYEDHVLGRLVADRRFEALRDAYAKLDEARQAAAVAVVVEHLLEGFKFEGGIAINAAAARRYLGRPGYELFSASRAACQPTGEELEPVLQAYDGLVQRARHTRTLLHDRDVFVVENLSVLSRLSQRVAIEQMVDAGEQLKRSLPRRIRRPPRRGSTVTAIQDDSVYPSGGFSAVSTAGSIENLVCSELVYMDNVGRSKDVDLFDVRYAEGELLYYTRDDNVFVRRRRAFSVILASDLPAARFSDAGLPWQRLVLTFGLIYSLIQRFSEWLSDEALEFEICFVVDDAGRNPLSEELELCRLLLNEWIEKGVVSIEQSNFDAAKERALVRSKRAVVDMMLITTDGSQLPQVFSDRTFLQKVRSSLLDISAATPRLVKLTGAKGALSDEPLSGERDAWPAWLAATSSVAKALI